VLAAWGTAVLSGAADAAPAVKAVSGDDEPHRVTVGGTALPLPEAAGLGDLLEVLGAAGATGLRVVLPTPGDVLGLPGPPDFNAEALEAGECVLVELPSAGETTWGVVPEVTVFGSAWEPGAMVTWQAHDARVARVTDFGGIAEADQELRVALDAATRELARLDVARWREDAAGRLALIRDGGVEPGLLPPTLPPRCLRVLATAARVRAIVELASEDDGGAVTGYEAGARSEALRGLDRVSRRAVVAALNGALERQT